MSNQGYASYPQSAVGATTPKEMTAVDTVNSRLYAINDHAREHITNLTALLSRAGFGEPSDLEKDRVEAASPPGFMATNQALDYLADYMHQIGELVAKLNRIA